MTLPTFTRASKSALDQKKRVQALYKECIRNSENICKIYSISYPPSVVRKTMRFLFDENSHATGKELDAALTKGQMELRETLMVWKQPTHVNRLIARYLEAKKESEKLPEGFLGAFLKGSR
eukprot:NODE_80_length_22829_cov_0.188121.p14 type:complete len:121 gc:universal NODE_80_length_22829_cov_0.188121:925-563(-)